MIKGTTVTFSVIMIAIFCFQNLTKVPLKIIFGSPVHLKLTYIIAVSFLAGFLSSLILWALIKDNNKNEF